MVYVDFVHNKCKITENTINEKESDAAEVDETHATESEQEISSVDQHASGSEEEMHEDGAEKCYWDKTRPPNGKRLGLILKFVPNL